MLNNAFFKLLFLASVTLLVSCSKSQSSGPEAALHATYTALENHDSIGFLQSLTLEQQNQYAMYPEKVTQILDTWKGDSAHIKILDIKQNDTFATVLYNLTVTGATPRMQDSLKADLYMHDGEWKHGF